MTVRFALAGLLLLGACSGSDDAARSEDPSKLSAELEERATEIETKADEAAAAVEREAAEELARLEAEARAESDAAREGEAEGDPATDDAVARK